GARAVEHEDAAVWVAGPDEAGADVLAAGAAVDERGRGRLERGGAGVSQLSRVCLAAGVAGEASAQNVGWQLGWGGWLVVGDLERPERSGDAGKVGRLGDLLVAQELGPGAVGGVGEILRGSLGGRVPARGRLGGVLPEKRPAAIGVSKPDHVAAAAPVSSSASLTTRCRRSSSSLSACASACVGVASSSALRGRPNQRRMPYALYEPMRAASRRATRCRRHATSSGVLRSALA